MSRISYLEQSKLSYFFKASNLDFLSTNSLHLQGSKQESGMPFFYIMTKPFMKVSL